MDSTVFIAKNAAEALRLINTTGVALVQDEFTVMRGKGLVAKEAIDISDVEVDAEIRRAAREQERDFADVKHHLKHDGGYEALRGSLAQDRALELVLAAASVKSA